MAELDGGGAERAEALLERAALALEGARVELAATLVDQGQAAGGVDRLGGALSVAADSPLGWG